MPQLQNLVLTDRAATPVAHTFVPREITGGVGTVVENGGVPVGNSTYSISLRVTADGRYKATCKLTVPIVQTETINGVSNPVVVRTARVTATFDFDKTSTSQERDNVIGMFADSLGTGKTLTQGVLKDLQGVY